MARGRCRPDDRTSLLLAHELGALAATRRSTPVSRPSSWRTSASRCIALGIARPSGCRSGCTSGTPGAERSWSQGPTHCVRSPSVGLLVLLTVMIAPHFHGRTDIGYRHPYRDRARAARDPADPVQHLRGGRQRQSRRVTDAARGMGMRGRQVLFNVELPCSLPLIFSGIRSATLQVIATATIASFVPLGGLGRFIYDGLQQQDYPQMIGGGVLVAGPGTRSRSAACRDPAVCCVPRHLRTILDQGWRACRTHRGCSHAGGGGDRLTQPYDPSIHPSYPFRQGDP